MTPNEQQDELVDKVARALYESEAEGFYFPGQSWETIKHRPVFAHWFERARAALKAIEQQHVIVPRTLLSSAETWIASGSTRKEQRVKLSNALGNLLERRQQ